MSGFPSTLKLLDLIHLLPELMRLIWVLVLLYTILLFHWITIKAEFLKTGMLNEDWSVKILMWLSTRRKLHRMENLTPYFYIRFLAYGGIATSMLCLLITILMRMKLMD